MISVSEAKAIVTKHAMLLNIIALPLDKALGYCLAQSVISKWSIPNFAQSSMDGYALQLAYRNNKLPIQDELPAGTSKKISLKEAHAVKVFTGGPVPENADVVIQKEWVNASATEIEIDEQKKLDPAIAAGLNIRKPGSDIQKGTVALEAGTILHSAHIAFLASIGETVVMVYRKPIVAIVITGNELVKPGNQLQDGEVFEANATGLSAALKQACVEAIHVLYTKDNLAETTACIQSALDLADMVLITGGVSVGDYDFVANACLNSGVEKLFHGVKQKPGKPLLFGKKENKLVVGLPGNPVSVLSCYTQYVLPAILQLSGLNTIKPAAAKLSVAYEKKSALCFFLKGREENGIVTVLPNQASYQLSSFATANCWIELAEDMYQFDALQNVPIYYI